MKENQTAYIVRNNFPRLCLCLCFSLLKLALTVVATRQPSSARYMQTNESLHIRNAFEIHKPVHSRETVTPPSSYPFFVQVV